MSKVKSLFISKLEKLYTYTNITPDFYKTDSFHFLRSHILNASLTPRGREKIRSHITNNIGNHFWNDYFLGLLYNDDNNIRKGYFKTSSDLGNPFAMCRYANLCNSTNIDECQEYYKKSANLGYYMSVLMLIDTMMPDTLSEFINLNPPEEVKSVLNDILPYLPLLESVDDDTAYEYLFEIYRGLQKYNYVSTDDIPYIYKEYHCAAQLQRDTENWGDYIYVEKDIMSDLISTKKELKTAKEKIVHLTKLNSMSVDEVIKSVVSEYL